MNSRYFLFFICLLSTIPSGVFADNKPVIKIGVIVPLTGDMAVHGIEIQRAMRMALDEAAPKRTHYSYTLRFEDNQLDAGKSVSAARRLIDVEHVDAIVTLWPPTANAVLPITEKSGVLQYTIAWDPNLAKSNMYLLSHQAMVDEIARSTLRLLAHQGKRRIAFLHMEETGFNLGASSLRSLAPSEGIDLVADQSFNPEETDFRSLLLRISRKSPDGYLVWSVMPSMDLVIRQIRDLNSKAYITGYLDYAEDLSLIQHTPYVSEMFASPSFTKSYRKEYGSEPISKGPNAFDITNLLIRAFESSPSKKPNAAQLKGYLVAVRDFPGAVGEFSIDQFGNSSYAPVVREVDGANRVLAALPKRQ